MAAMLNTLGLKRRREGGNGDFHLFDVSNANIVLCLVKFTIKRQSGFWLNTGGIVVVCLAQQNEISCRGEP